MTPRYGGPWLLPLVFAEAAHPGAAQATMLTAPTTAGTAGDLLRSVLLLLAMLIGLSGAGGYILVALRSAGGQPADTPWPMFQHDGQHTGRSPFVGPQSYALKCEFPVSGEGTGSPAIGTDGTLYIPSGTVSDGAGFLYAMNPNCTQKWVYTLPGPPASTAPAISAEGTIYVHVNGPQNLVSIERLIALNPDGTLRWQFEFNAGSAIFTSNVQSSPVIAPDGTIYVGSIDTNLYALNPDGTVKWAVSPTLSSISSSPVRGHDGTIYIMDATCTLFAFSKIGDPLWNFDLSAGTCYDASPSVGTDGTVYIGGPFERDVYAINADGTLKCKFLTGWTIVSTPAIAVDGTIYVGSDFLYALNPNCTLKWKIPQSGVSFSSSSAAIGADGTIYWQGGRGLYGLNPDGTVKWSRADFDSPGGGTLDPSGAIGADGILYWVDSSDSFNPTTRLRAIGPATPGSADSDGDGVRDAVETACGSAPLNPASVPERIDTSGDDDGDTLVNEALPPGAEAYDCDGDGYAGSVEKQIFGAVVTVNDQDPCGSTGWPSDLITGAPTPVSLYNRVNVVDLGNFVAPVRRINPNPNPNYHVRWDLNADGMIGVPDLAVITVVAGYPTMLGGQRAFGGPPCPWAPYTIATAVRDEPRASGLTRLRGRRRLRHISAPRKEPEFH